MQRKMKLVRRLMEYVEMSQTEHMLPVPEMDEYTDAEVHYNLGLCGEAGYLALGQPQTTGQRRRFRGIAGLTWAGHEALEKMRAGGTGPNP